MLNAQRAYSHMLRLCGTVCGAYDLAYIASAKLAERQGGKGA
jgi:hypothetical protein